MSQDVTPSDDTVKMTIPDAAEALKIEPRSVYRRIETKGWLKIQDSAGRSFVLVPKSAIEEAKMRPVKDKTETKPQTESVTSRTDMDVLFDRLSQIYDSQIDDLRQQVTSLRQDKEILNRELENRNFQIQKYREKEKENPWWKLWK